MWQYIVAAGIILALLVAGFISWGWASQATAISTQNLIQIFLSNWIYLTAFLLLLILGAIVIIRLARGEIDKGTAWKYFIIMTFFGIIVSMGIPIVTPYFGAYKVKTVVALYNQPAGKIVIKEAYVDKTTFQRMSLLSFYKPAAWIWIPIGPGIVIPIWVPEDTVTVNYHISCYRGSNLIYDKTETDIVTVPEMSTRVIEHWLENLPPMSYCKLTIWLSGKEADPTPKVISFTVPR